MLLVRFYLNITHAFGWDSGRIKSFMRLQKQYDEIPTETARFLSTIDKYGLTGQPGYGLSGQAPKDKALNELTDSYRPLVFLIGGKLQPKKWPLQHWITLANLIGEDQHILIAGGESEYNEAEQIISETKNTKNVCGQLSITELYHVLTKSALAISLDTGAMHLCDAAGIKVIALMSTRDLTNKWQPNYKDSVVIEKVLPCSFCLKTVCSDNICMKYITPAEVFSAYSKIYSCET